MGAKKSTVWTSARSSDTTKDPRVVERLAADENARIGRVARAARAPRDRSPGPILAAQPAQRANCVRRKISARACDSMVTAGWDGTAPGWRSRSTPRRRRRRSRPARRAAGAATCTVERAGRASPSMRPYTSFTRGKSAMSCRKTVVFTTSLQLAPAALEHGRGGSCITRSVCATTSPSHDLAGRRVERDLAGGEQEAAGDDAPASTGRWPPGPCRCVRCERSRGCS